MATQAVQHQVHAHQGDSTQVTPVKYNGHTIVPAAHGKKTICANVFTGILQAAMLIAGAVLWGLNASQGGDPSMLLAGQVLTGLALGGIAVRIIALCYKNLCTGKPAGDAK